MEEGKAELVGVLSSTLLAKAGDAPFTHKRRDIGSRHYEKLRKESDVDDEAAVFSIDSAKIALRNIHGVGRHYALSPSWSVNGTSNAFVAP